MLGGHCVRSIHSEINAIVQASRSGTSLLGSTLYVNRRTCVRCTLVIIQAGITRVVYREAYDTDSAREDVMKMYAQAKVQVYQMKEAA